LLRPEFGRARATARERSGAVRKILVFFGAAHAPEWTLTAIEALASIERGDIHVDVVIGGQQPRGREIERACNDHGFICHVQTRHMAELMSAADLAIGAGGSAHWERCCLGLPCVTFVLATNQRQLVRDSALAGLLYAPESAAPDRDTLARHVRACLENPLLLASLSRNALATVDGRGTARLLREMGLFAVDVRRARADDCERMFEWRNHPQVRAVSRNTAPLARSGHEAWFAAVLADSSRMLLIGEVSGEPVGVVRFDIADETAEVSIYSVPGRDRQGRGTELLLAAERMLCDARPDIRQIRAEVLEGNVQSQRLFASAAYSTHGSVYSKRLRE
jgi:RimJ/RimL family protein N-acetyltransferase